MGSVSPHPHTQATFRMPAILELNNVTFAFIAGTASDIQYSATGGSDDWARGVAGIKWVYLVELPGKGHGFLVPPRSVFIIVSRKKNMIFFISDIFSRWREAIWKVYGILSPKFTKDCDIKYRYKNWTLKVRVF